MKTTLMANIFVKLYLWGQNIKDQTMLRSFLNLTHFIKTKPLRHDPNGSKLNQEIPHFKKINLFLKCFDLIFK